jgi:hypothetical protein
MTAKLETKDQKLFLKLTLPNFFPLSEFSLFAKLNIQMHLTFKASVVDANKGLCSKRDLQSLIQNQNLALLFLLPAFLKSMSVYDHV